MNFRARNHCFDLDTRTLIMGILNTTPDSFSEDGAFAETDSAVAHGLGMAKTGADIIDVGGESTRPGAKPVDAKEEMRRVLPVISGIRQESDVCISIDTTKADVARAAIDAGADAINDISGFHRDPKMIEVAAATGAGCVVMHMVGTPQNMQANTVYDDIIKDITDYLSEAIARLAECGIGKDRIAVDPGIGFSKTARQSLYIMACMGAFTDLGCAVLIGPSRKSFIDTILAISTPSERKWGTAAAVTLGVLYGARIIRVHDVPEMRQVADMTMAMVLRPSPDRQDE